ncbi:unnamed protein product [Blepharisma stoltei]|uniref:HMG box domain-containing protein n=1 Tax=Blepharisma stoltei TaxID=1481888 RepID=A0AAU9K4H1_9CILI|nr:unnamed protein product [Blepharisma stoltei]
MPKKGNSGSAMKCATCGSAKCPGCEPMKEEPKKPMNKKKVVDSESEQEEEKEEKKVEGPKPKKARSAYIFFCNEKRPDLDEEFKGKEAMKKLGAMWKACSEAEKQPYADLAEKDKERYERQTKEFEETGEFHDEDGNVVTEDKPKKKRSMSAKKETMGAKRKAGGKKKC